MGIRKLDASNPIVSVWFIYNIGMTKYRVVLYENHS